MTELTDEEFIKEIKRQYAYDGKPKQYQQGFDAACKEIAELLSRLSQGRKAIEACKSFESLINESQEVYGLHLNGDPAPWEELLEGGRFEDWLIKFSEWQQSKEANDAL